MKFIADYSVEANGFIVVYMANYYWKVRKDLSMARSVLTSNKDRCQKSLPFWKFFMNSSCNNSFSCKPNHCFWFC